MKYEFTGEVKVELGVTLKRIRVVTASADLAAGAVGGWIADAKNLSQDGNAWVFGNAWVCGDAWVSGNARVFGDAWVCGDAQVFGDAWVSGDARVSGDAWVCGDAQVSGNAWVSGNARVFGNAQVSGKARVYGDADFLLVGPIGSRRAFLTIHADTKLKVRYTTGCFTGSRAEFMKAVKETHKVGTLYRTQYDAALVMAKLIVGAK